VLVVQEMGVVPTPPEMLESNVEVLRAAFRVHLATERYAVVVASPTAIEAFSK